MNISIVTLGCKINQYESQLYRENFRNNGFGIKDFPEPSDIVLINTCCVTKRAEKESRNFIRRSLRNSSKVIVTGCYVEKETQSLLEKFPIEIVKREDLLNNGYFGKKVNKIHSFYHHTRAFIKIEDGCERFCSYCIIPYVRGRVKNRNSREILEEIKGLAENGYREFVLTGIDLGAYEKLADLLIEVKKIKGVGRIRLSSLEPKEITGSLIETLASSPKFCPHLHIPLQSGDDKILKLMNRDYSAGEYERLIEEIREKIPKACFTTDVMVGFPGEDKEAFCHTLAVVKRVGFSKIHCFRYSLREGTKAFKLPSPVKEEEKWERAKELRVLAEKISRKIKENFPGKTFSVLVEEKRKEGGYSFGYSENYLPVLIEGSEKPGVIVKVRIKEIKDNCLFGVAIK
ncbi:MAG: tRNA (N(6)-L-threonylcarbamoyladenosine(37)-C(2))-methylthiotransferase MtaB [bacterium (Candidatus Ratteibacteria) CG_4_10_14_3_um_filter_41_18]|uniref:tRNA (N(6)-L-threonylcarbamoyladenosine(37)-C(2))-methylthiotransferase MtaB n=4 Tax=Candidatus Ratteibacteria TaxID=2979319 RepID=A0A2M7YDQ9_9BACT|nr:MAG: hypothetical protein AUJ76_04120 [Candidatus Omnitrophica bacterium CG1_02_41_171]PIV64363.1 MAG: tRNA (N(6)-L-threonylcarbamoyladenosine(37)-C(2))-methylthiotransferase MtaB [bacterium (Candidatus Ratteibacteria) CG01_land_8_20_14_3_00_40_19]PIW33973.1 MAG: tRNA (N(6)-L-threonylcarbamoyladenosine(37)-C(2))-methylthiotransferase MtaB [bacterium (Candidatus Ratteibacteria) CG15_BIG_FIL_POST_REV_8_21_14_020_41_12]PIW74546.1 MAG: tRNA (N(6)-L-threonylcarbamoyladenosine(37)-C(2))-methylthiot